MPATSSIAMLSGIAEIVDRYDGFILDIWGVLHDGHHPYPGVVDCLARLRAAGRRICLLSNAPRRSDGVVRALAALGIARDAYDHVYTSGEAVWQHLVARPDDWHRRLGERVYHMGPPRGDGILRETSCRIVDTPEEADFVVATGIGHIDETLADYEDALQRAARRGLPFVCANPDLVVNAGRRTAMCAGTMAARYEALGGDVRYHGKPHAPVYARCRELLDIADPRRLVAIGDSFRTDVAGALGAGIDAVFVTGGIHREELGGSDTVDPRHLQTLAETSGAIPRWAIGSLRW